MAKARRKAKSPAAKEPESAPRGKPRRVVPMLTALLAIAALLWWQWPRSDGKQNAPAEISGTSAGSMPLPKPAHLPPVLDPEDKVFATYAGSESCRECHRQLHDLWAKSNHGNAERRLKPEMDGSAFIPEHGIHHGSQESAAIAKDGTFSVKTLGFENRIEAYPLARLVGHDPLRQFLVERPGGRFQTLELAFDPKRNEWFDIFGNEDRKPGEWGHWTGRGMTWNSMCASCHNTRLRKNYDEATDTYRTAMAEMSVGCESCHGPMRAHAEWRRQYPQSKEPDPTAKQMSRDQVFDTCGSCHARRRELTGDFVPGDSFGQHFQLTTVDESDLYFADGQVRDELYEYGSFHGSKMHTAGVRCVDCHDPHFAKPVLAGNALCMRCHSGAPQQIPGTVVIAPVIDPVAHSFHKTDSAGAQCVSCHMPVTTYMQRHPRHDHGFTIPDPLLTKQLAIPNACNRCHTDKNADWSLAATEKWWGEKMKRPSRERALRVAEARAGNAPSAAQLLALLRDEPNAYWKASLIRLLGPWSGEADVTRAFLEYAQHPDSLVRTAAVHSLESIAAAQGESARQVLTRRLEDPERVVRVAAASALQAPPDAASRASRELAHALDLAADQPTGQLHKGAWAQSHGDATAALRHFERAVSWDPNSGGIRHEYAILLSSLGRTQDALKQIGEAVRLEPKQAEFHFKLALAWNETGSMENAVKEFEETVRLDRKHARAWYNLGLARNALGQTEAAITSLREAEAADPRDARIPYARATIHARLRQTTEAREAARRALAIQPDYQDARSLLQTLPP